MDQQVEDYREAKDVLSITARANNSNLGLLVLAAAIDRVAQAINELEIRVVTKKPEGL